MAVTTVLFNKFKQKLLSGANAVDFDADTLKLALVTSSWTPNIDTDDFWDDVSANEVTNGSGYTTGGVTLASVTTGLDTTGDFGYADATDPGWTALTKTFRYAVLYKDTGTPGTSPLILYVDFGTNQSPAGVDFNLVLAAPASGGLLKIA